MAVKLKLRRSGRRRKHSKRLRTVATFPTLLTLGNLLSGFACIYFCMRSTGGVQLDPASVDPNLLLDIQERILPSFLSIGALLIFLGLLCDALDGSVARLTKSTSDFGGQLDSLADIVTFGVAPALLVVAVVMQDPQMAAKTGPLAASLMGRAMWMMAAVYVTCAALRLARFNVEHDQPDMAVKHFNGLPAPGAAVVIASLIMLHQDTGYVQPYLSIMLPGIALLLGLLMVSRVHYVHLANAYLRGRRPFGHVVAMVFLLAVFWWYKELTLALVVCSYAASGPVGELIRRVRPLKPDPDKASDAKGAARQDHGRPQSDQRSA